MSNLMGVPAVFLGHYIQKTVLRDVVMGVSQVPQETKDAVWAAVETDWGHCDVVDLFPLGILLQELAGIEESLPGFDRVYEAIRTADLGGIVGSANDPSQS